MKPQETPENDIRRATQADVDALTELFWNHLQASPAYISHGEIQMGIAMDSHSLAPDGRSKWSAYIARQIAGPDSGVFVAEDAGAVAGFVAVETAEDGDDAFGLVCDLLVGDRLRGRGMGRALLGAGMDWLRDRGVKDIYLESGLDNHSAHAFFEARGFRPVSKVFRYEPES